MKPLRFVFALLPSAALAEDAMPVPSVETVIVIGTAPDPDTAPAVRDRQRALGDAPFITVVHADEHPATTSVADALGATVGAQTRSLGGLGGYESVSIRGTSPGHTSVTIDGVPLARIAAVTTDVGRFALASFGEAVLYRGSVPLELGGAGVGGALDLVTRLGRGERGERVDASIGAGSFGARHLHIHYGDAHANGALQSSTTIHYQGATGDYTYYVDNGTPLNLGDDRYAKRTNSAFDQVDLSTRLGMANRGAAGIRAAYKNQGLPGSAANTTRATSLSTLDVVMDGRGEIELGGGTAKQLGYLLVERQRLHDPRGELGLGIQVRDYMTFSGGASSTWSARWGRHRFASGVDLRADWFSDSDVQGARTALHGNRVGAAALAAFDLAVDPTATVVITPAVRLDVLRTAPTPMLEGASERTAIPPRVELVPSPRVSVLARVQDDLSIKTSAGWYLRIPTLIELFGNRGTIVGSPTLRPERGPNAEAGFVYAPAHAIEVPMGDLPKLVIDRMVVEAAGFATYTQDTIAFVPYGGFVARAMNVANAVSYGAEVVGSVRFARAISITANYTRLMTAQRVSDPAYANKPLPRQPGHALYARADITSSALGRRTELWFDAHWHSDTFLDQASLQRVPARILMGTGARVELGANVGLSLAVANLADQRIEYLPLVPAPRPDLTRAPMPLSDVSGYPLPGRSFDISLDWSFK